MPAEAHTMAQIIRKLRQAEKERHTESVPASCQGRARLAGELNER
jgi:hypothetical protein